MRVRQQHPCDSAYVRVAVGEDSQTIGITLVHSLMTNIWRDGFLHEAEIKREFDVWLSARTQMVCLKGQDMQTEALRLVKLVQSSVVSAVVEAIAVLHRSRDDSETFIERRDEAGELGRMSTIVRKAVIQRC